MKMTVLELVQAIMSSMDSDAVNSIADTPESQQVAAIVEETYNYLVSSIDLPEHYTLFELIASGDSNFPCIMTLPSGCLSLEWLKYNNELTGDSEPSYKEVCYVDLKEFVDRMHGLSENEDDIEMSNTVLNGETFEQLYYNDRMPSFFTVVDDSTLLFDAYDSDEDTTLQKSKTMAFGRLIPTFTRTDNFTPALDAQQFTLLLNEAKSQAFAELKQTQNAIADRRARKGWIKSQITKRAVGPSYYNNLPDFSRRV